MKGPIVVGRTEGEGCRALFGGGASRGDNPTHCCVLQGDVALYVVVSIYSSVGSLYRVVLAHDIVLAHYIYRSVGSLSIYSSVHYI